MNIIAVAIATLSNLLSFSTPDGQTPAEEETCDIYSGKTFGLCNAFCEALDCNDPDQVASEDACQSIADNLADALSDGGQQVKLPNCGNIVSECGKTNCPLPYPYEEVAELCLAR